MADLSGGLLEDFIPVVKYNGIRSNKDMTFGDDATVSLPAATTIDGQAVVALGDITSTSTTATAFSVTNTGIFTGASVVTFVADSLTTGTQFLLSADGITSGHMVSITSSGTLVTTGDLLNVVASGATTSTGVVRVTTAALTTGVAMVITANALTTGSALSVVSNSAETDTRSIATILQDHASASGSTVLTLTQDAAAGVGLKINGIGTTGVALHVDNASGVQSDNTGMVFLDHGGNMAAGSNILRIAPTGTPVETSVAIEVVGASKTIQGLVIDTDAATASANVITGGGIRSADTAVLSVIADVASSNADSQVVRINQSSATGANVPLGILQADVSEPLVLFESTAGSGNAIDTTNTTPAAVFGSILVSINGVDKRLAVYDTPFT